MTLPAEFLRAISRHDLADLPVRRYEGQICLVSTPQEADRAMADIRSEGVVGFDTETRPAFTKGRSYLPCLAQIATARAVYLFRLQYVDASAHLAELLAAHGTVKVGVALADDLRRLRQLFAFEARRVLDPGIVANHHGLAQTGLRNLAGIFLGFRIPKGARTSNWAAARLSAAQINYAATDAWACRELFLCFERLGLLATAEYTLQKPPQSPAL